MDSKVRDDQSLAPVHEPGRSPSPAAVLDVILLSGKVLFANGQTTEKIVFALQELAAAGGFQVTLFANWGELTVHLKNNANSYSETITVEPAGVDMSKVSATMNAIHRVCAGKMDFSSARSALQEISESGPVSLARFALLAGAGAAALGVIFGVDHPASLILIALIAGAGACLRRWLARLSHNLFVQPFCAAFLAGIAGAPVGFSRIWRAIALIPPPAADTVPRVF